MRIISFSQRWPKLLNQEFTTFRYPRKDKDWFVGEAVQIFFKSRSPQREKLGDAIIVNKVLRFGPRDDKEAQDDGFIDTADMERWMRKTYGEAKLWERINKLTLKRVG